MLKEGYHCWEFIKTYDAMWDLYMVPGGTRAAHVMMMVDATDLTSMLDEYDLVVNTAPRKSLCINPRHEFIFKQVEITDGSSYPNQPEDTTIFNAGDKFPWVRSAYLLGNQSTEWLVGTAPEELNPVLIRKPISHNCNCLAQVLCTGRFGAWKNETWVDTAYYDVRDAIVSMLRQDGWDRVK
jgi:hypothetical protein